MLVSCFAEGASPTADRTEGGGGVATLITGLAHPNPWQQYGCNFHPRVLLKLSLALDKAQKSVLLSALIFVGDAELHLSLLKLKRRENQC